MSDVFREPYPPDSGIAVLLCMGLFSTFCSWERGLLPSSVRYIKRAADEVDERVTRRSFVKRSVAFRPRLASAALAKFHVWAMPSYHPAPRRTQKSRAQAQMQGSNSAQHP